MDELTVGQPAPDFTLPATGGKTLSLSDFRGRNVVLYFYPKDMTPGCTREAADFSRLADAFAAADTVILGVSTDDVASHEKFAAKHNIPFPLLSDTEAEVCRRYGVWKEKKNFGKTYMGIERSTFVIDRGGNIAKIWRKVKVDGHAEEVLAFVREHLA
ncbi:MAG: thioredoxin-dependent thiol peroxidase [Calditerricola sp.]|jgi:Peroxiredoxin|nr:thioredoxin-dependent thiol peroxidase [Bacillota bacterium]MCG0314323.1 thioredoxin-dependent thiol peroxidase [Calditerricola sp.]